MVTKFTCYMVFSWNFTSTQFCSITHTQIYKTLISNQYVHNNSIQVHPFGYSKDQSSGIYIIYNYIHKTYALYGLLRSATLFIITC